MENKDEKTAEVKPRKYRNKPDVIRILENLQMENVALKDRVKFLEELRDSFKIELSKEQSENQKSRELVKELIPIVEEYRVNIVFGPLRKDKREKTTAMLAIISKASYGPSLVTIMTPSGALKGRIAPTTLPLR